MDDEFVASDRMLSAAARDAWREWLRGFCFNVFGTITFRVAYPATVSGVALRRLDRLKLPRPFFAVAEQHRHGGNWHVHLLVRVPAEGDRVRWWCRLLWSRAFEHLGRARFVPVRGDPVGYCCKYMLKHGFEWRLEA